MPEQKKRRPSHAKARVRLRPALSQDLAARDVALTLLESVSTRQGAVDRRLDAAVEALDPRDRAFARMLAATVLRRRGQMDDLLAAFVQRRPSHLVQNILRLGIAQLLFLRTPAHAAVATAVELVKHRGQGQMAGLVNAVLRRAAEKGPDILARQDEARLNTPDWLLQSWAEAYGAAAARDIALAHLIEPPLDLTVKDPSAAAHWAARLDAAVLPTGTLRRASHGRIQDLPGYDEGAWWVQDAAAALPAKILLHTLGEAKGKTVIDLCAAPGGKTLQLAAAGCAVTAVDSAAGRLALLRENLARIRLDTAVVEADLLHWTPPRPADAVLLDAPCSATGTISRHPDLPYLKRPADFAAFAERQKRLLAAAAAMVKPGGVVVYSVCSLQPEEGGGLVEAVLSADARLARLPIPPPAVAGQAQFINAKGDLRTLPSHWKDLGGLDGFYGAVLRVAA